MDDVKFALPGDREALGGRGVRGAPGVKEIQKLEENT